MNARYSRVIRQYVILSFLFSACGGSIVGATYASFLIANGLSLFQVNAVNACFFLTLFLFEIPTGAFADTLGRKTAVVSAFAFWSAGMFVYAWSHSFAWFVAAEVLSAVGYTFKNGAFQAWLVDTLKHEGCDVEREPLSRVFSLEAACSQAGGGIGAIAGSYAFAVSPALPWSIGAWSSAAVGLIAFIVMKEEYFVRRPATWGLWFSSMGQVMRSSWRYAKEHAPVRFVLVVTLIEVLSVQAVNMYWQPFFGSFHVSATYYGYIFFGVNASLFAGALAVRRIGFSGRERAFILWSLVAAGAMIIAASVAQSLFLAIAFFLAQEVARGGWRPMNDSYLQQRIPSEERATISSFCSTAPHIGGTVGLLASGSVAQALGIPVAWALSGCALVIGALFVGRLARERPRDRLGEAAVGR